MVTMERTEITITEVNIQTLVAIIMTAGAKCFIFECKNKNVGTGCILQKVL
jgi:hypothetical protein